MDTPSVAACISAFGETCLLREIYSKLVATSWIHRIYILDGPFRFASPVYASAGVELGETTSRIAAELRGKEKVYYAYHEFENEREKRIQLYDWAEADVVLLLDTDELPLELEAVDIQEFWRSPYAVAAVDMVNVCSRHHQAGEASKKYAIFKKAEISATRHLDYTWLVGVDQQQPEHRLMQQEPLLSVLHFFLLRNRQSLHEKYIFYNCLWFATHGHRVPTSVRELALTKSITYGQNGSERLAMDSLISLSRDYLGGRRSDGELKRLAGEHEVLVQSVLDTGLIEDSYPSTIMLSAELPSYIRIQVPANAQQSPQQLSVELQTNTAMPPRVSVCRDEGYLTNEIRQQGEIPMALLAADRGSWLFSAELVDPSFCSMGYVFLQIDPHPTGDDGSSPIVELKEASFQSGC